MILAFTRTSNLDWGLVRGQFSYLTQDNEVDEEDRWSRKRRMMTGSSGFVISPVGDQILAARHQIQYNTDTNTLQV